MSAVQNILEILLAVAVCIALVVRLKTLMNRLEKDHIAQRAASELLANDPTTKELRGKITSKVLARYAYSSALLYIIGFGLFYVLGQYSHKDAPLIAFSLPVIIVAFLVAAIGVLYSWVKRRSLNSAGRWYQVSCVLLFATIFIAYCALAIYVTYHPQMQN